MHGALIYSHKLTIFSNWKNNIYKSQTKKYVIKIQNQMALKVYDLFIKGYTAKVGNKFYPINRSNEIWQTYPHNVAAALHLGC